MTGDSKNRNSDENGAVLKKNENDTGTLSKGTPESTGDNKKASNANYENSFNDNDLDQMETDLSSLSNNFKKRRLSKNEMDFLETELNLDIENITDADFDIHLQKLMSDNNNNGEAKDSTNKTNEAKGSESGKKPQKLIGETKEESKPSEIVNDVKENSSISTVPEVSQENKDHKPIQRDNIEKQDENTDTKEKEIIETKDEKESEDNAIKEENSTNEEAIDHKTDELFNEPEVNIKENVECNKMTEDASKKETSFEMENSTNQQSALNINTTITSTYRGVSVPSNSELFKIKDSNGALKAYKLLLQDNDTPTEINHANAQLAALPLTITAPDYLSFNVQMLINTLPVLDNLATQILRIVAKGPYQKVMELVSNRESYTGIAFGNLVELFETTKRIYNSEESPFFTVENITFGLWKYGAEAPSFLRGREDTIEGTLRKVNLLTFLLATLGLIDLGFFFLNEAFLDVFCPPQNLDPSDSLSLLKNNENLSVFNKNDYNNNLNKLSKNQTKFLKSQAILYLELKTQAYISAIELGDRSKEEIIHDLFPDNMAEILLRRKDPYYTGHPIERNSTFFTPAELDFLNRCEFRKQTLLSSKTDSSLMEKYEWIKFLNDLLEYVSKNVGFLIWGPKGKLSAELDKINSLRQASILNDAITVKKESDEVKMFTNESTDENNKRNHDEMKAEEVNTDINNLNDINTAELVNEKAVKKNPPAPKAKRQRQNRPSTFRRVWTKEEEDTLKKGLELKGTHWTAILELYGPGGKINENLKNRSSLQLKDKARNWKLFYIKNNMTIPEYLKKKQGSLRKSPAPLKRPKTSEKLTTPIKPAISINEGIDESEVYHHMLDGMLSEGKTADKQDDAVASELKELVAEAFK